MSHLAAKQSLTGLAMLMAAGLAYAMIPTEKTADIGPHVDLEALIPKQFAGWQTDKSVVPILPNLDVQAELRQIYTQTVARTYVNRKGEMMMLSIAYGSDQRKNTRLHRPEVCYAAQGFKIIGLHRAVLFTRYGRLPVQRLVAIRGLRHEPITYWLVVGDRATYSGLSQMLAQLRYGLSGIIADGILVRVSSIDSDRQRAYRKQENFVKDMINAITPEQRHWLIGKVRA